MTTPTQEKDERTYSEPTRENIKSLFLNIEHRGDGSWCDIFLEIDGVAQPPIASIWECDGMTMCSQNLIHFLIQARKEGKEEALIEAQQDAYERGLGDAAKLCITLYNTKPCHDPACCDDYDGETYALAIRELALKKRPKGEE